METRQCQNCKNSFNIEPDDFSFYEKIKVPPPTWCPNCRAQRRMVWRNERNLFRKKDHKTGQEIFSQYHENSPIKIYINDYWLSDDWSPLDYGRDYDFTIPFFTQFKELLYSVPAKARVLTNAVNSEYCSNVDGVKNCYLCFNATSLEDCGYTTQSLRMRNCYDLSTCSSSENCFDCINITDSNNLQSCADCADSVDLLYCIDCRNCQDCIGCVGLRNKNNCIFNVQYTRDEYKNILTELNINSHESRQGIKSKTEELYSSHFRKYMHTMKSVDSSGDYIFGSKDTKDSWLTMKTENVRYSQDTRYTKDAYDALVCWIGEEVYESTACGLDSSQLKFIFNCHPGCLDISYSAFCSNSSHLFGCVGLRNKEYCVFNKQYSKGDYEKLVEKIIEQMNALPYINTKGHIYKYGEFFPPELSPLAYTETIAPEFYPLNEEEAKAGGFLWRNHDDRNYTVTLLTKDIPNEIKDIPESIVNEIIECEDKSTCNHDCTKAFRIISQEFSFYKKMGIPLPRKCPNCRYGERLSLRGGMEYWKRECMCNKEGHNHIEKCKNEFETSYSPDGPEIIYCESCYQQEVV